MRKGDVWCANYGADLLQNPASACGSTSDPQAKNLRTFSLRRVLYAISQLERRFNRGAAFHFRVWAPRARSVAAAAGEEGVQALDEKLTAGNTLTRLGPSPKRMPGALEALVTPGMDEIGSGAVRRGFQASAAQFA